MSILKYFKRAPKTALDELLPDPDGTLSKIVPPSAIKMANDEVAKVVNDEERKSDTSTDEPRGTQSRPNGYLILTPSTTVRSGQNSSWIIPYIFVHVVASNHRFN